MMISHRSLLRLYVGLQFVLLMVQAQEEVSDLLLPFLSSDQIASIGLNQCRVTNTNNVIRKIPPPYGKLVYKVGVLGNRGIDTLYKEYNLTFADYLTSTVGSRFDPPLRFEIYPLLFGEDGILDKAISSDYADFTFMNPALFSCVESEVGASSLATFINRRVVNGKVYEMSQFGGVMFVSRNNTDIHSVEDMKGKKAAAASVTGLGSGQMQFRELQQAGLHHFQSVQQLIFVESQSRVVEAVLLGQVDVGFVRTDQLERSKDPRTGQPLDLSEIRILANQNGTLLATGEPFPVGLSTPLYPEWNFASLPHVDYEVQEQVQASLLAMREHASMATPLLDCYATRNCTAAEVPQQCEIGFYLDLVASVQEEFGDECSVSATTTTSPATALLASNAMTNAKCGGWIPSKSYMTIRNMQEEIGFIETTITDDQIRCKRTSELVDAVVCPAGHFRKPRNQVLTGCQSLGLDCYGYQCLCSPCVKAYDVDFFPVDLSSSSSLQLATTEEAVIATTQETLGLGCSKFAVCGEVRQGESILFRLVDNLQRLNATFVATVFVSDEGETYTMTTTPGTTSTGDNNSDNVVSREFIFDASGRSVSTVIVQVNVDGEQIPESPFRFRIIPPICEEPLVPSASGNCLCPSNTIFLFGKCFKLWTVMLATVAIGSAFVGLVAWIIIDRKRKQMDAIWKVDKAEIIFDDPPRELGQGTFGVVLLAEYRGTAVAVKKILPPNAARAPRSNGSKRKVLSAATNSLDQMEEGEAQQQVGLQSTFIARGSNGRVSMGSESKYGGKAFGRSSMNSLKREVIREMRTLSKLRHPCIVAVMGAVIEKYEAPTLLTEYMELGSLTDILQNESMILGGEIIVPMLQDIAQGLRFLHTAKPQIVHCDIKGQNILVDARFHAKLSDFGLTVTSKSGNLKARGAAGTPFWMAPELLRGESSNTVESDIYAFGITLSEILSRKDPFHGELHLNVIEQLKDPRVTKYPFLPAQCPPAARELMMACLRPNPKMRPTAKDIDMRVKAFEPTQFDSAMGNKPRCSMGKSNAESDLLAQLFPKHIADALREGRNVEPENHECVTVYFSDICGYTEISSTLSPAKVSSLLHRLYSKFDNLCESHDLFKVETVGDAYMVATLNESNTADNHVALVARFAFDAVAAAASTLIDEDDPSRGYVQIRVGFHSGPVVTHVVGHRNPRYSVIGDVVNTASRMESNSAPGRVTTSQFSADLLAKQCPEIGLKSRGKVMVKGKGKMDIFWVEPPADFESSQKTLTLSTDDESSSNSTLTAASILGQEQGNEWVKENHSAPIPAVQVDVQEPPFEDDPNPNDYQPTYGNTSSRGFYRQFLLS